MKVWYCCYTDDTTATGYCYEHFPSKYSAERRKYELSAQYAQASEVENHVADENDGYVPSEYCAGLDPEPQVGCWVIPNTKHELIKWLDSFANK